MANLNWNRPVHRINKESKVLGPKSPELPLVEHKMTFGKYKGFSLKALPTQYLEWLITITPDDTQALKYARELSTRSKYKEPVVVPKQSFANDESHSYGIFCLKNTWKPDN